MWLKTYIHEDVAAADIDERSNCDYVDSIMSTFNFPIENCDSTHLEYEKVKTKN